MAGNILGTLLLLIKTRGDTSGLDRTRKSLILTDNALKRVHKHTGMLGKMSRGLFGGFNFASIGYGFSRYLQFEKDIGAMKSRFFAVTHDEKQAEEEFDYIRKLATRTAMDIKKTADSYSIFSSATFKHLGRDGAREVFENWTRVSRVLHLSEYQFERVTYALREMASKGAIYSQDLRMQIGTHVPNAMGLAQKAAEEMGITGTDWFDKLQKTAKGNTEVTTKFVRLFSKYAREAFGSEDAFKKAMQQPDALAKEIGNIGYNFMIDFSKAGGSYMIVKILRKVSEILLSIDYNKLTRTLGSIARGVGDLTEKIPELINILKWILIWNVAFKSILGFTRLFGKFFFFKKMFTKSSLSRFISRFGFTGLLTRLLNKFFLGTGFKLALAAGFNAVPIIGQILSILMFIWTGWSIIRDILKILNIKFGDKKDEIFKIYGITSQALKDMLLQAKADSSINSTEALRKRILEQTNNELLSRQVYYKQGDVYVTVKDNEIRAEDISSVVEHAKKGAVKGNSIIPTSYSAVPKVQDRGKMERDWRRVGGK